jgi:sulfur-carrier protein
VKVLLPTPLADYTAHRREVEAQGATLDELFRDLDRRFPGLRFRVIDEQDAFRPHIKVFVNRAQAGAITAALRPDDEVLVVAALSGG